MPPGEPFHAPRVGRWGTQRYYRGRKVSSITYQFDVREDDFDLEISGSWKALDGH